LITAARQLSTALAPFGFALLTAGLGVFSALWINVVVGLFGICAFGAIAILHARTYKAAQAREIAAVAVKIG
jgi:hypothetical protein